MSCDTLTAVFSTSHRHAFVLVRISGRSNLILLFVGIKMNGNMTFFSPHIFHDSSFICHVQIFININFTNT